MDPHWFDKDPGPSFIRIRNLGLRWPKNCNNFTAEKIIFLIKNGIYLSLGLHTGRPSYRRSLQTQKRTSSTSKHEISLPVHWCRGRYRRHWHSSILHLGKKLVSIGILADVNCVSPASPFRHPAWYIADYGLVRHWQIMVLIVLMNISKKFTLWSAYSDLYICWNAPNLQWHLPAHFLCKREAENVCNAILARISKESYNTLHAQILSFSLVLIRVADSDPH